NLCLFWFFLYSLSLINISLGIGIVLLLFFVFGVCSIISYLPVVWFLTLDKVLLTVNTPVLKSISDHFKPNNSPKRKPVPSAIRNNISNLWPFIASINSFCCC